MRGGPANATGDDDEVSPHFIAPWINYPIVRYTARPAQQNERPSEHHTITIPLAAMYFAFRSNDPAASGAKVRLQCLWIWQGCFCEQHLVSKVCLNPPQFAFFLFFSFFLFFCTNAKPK